MKRAIAVSLLSVPLIASSALAQTPVNLNSWSAESYQAVSGFGSGVWTVAGGGVSVNQTVNGQPTFFVGDFNAQGQQLNGTLRVNSSGGDDDFIGFALGYRSGDNTNAAADYLLVDWKRASQSFNFGAPANLTPGGNAPRGLAVSRVTGTPTADELWQHKNLVQNPTGGVEELARGATLGNTGWEFNTDYEFGFVFLPNQLQVFVDNTLQMTVNGAFGDGRFAFYNFSQASVNYSSFTQRQASVPEPSSAALGALSLLALAGMTFRRRSSN